MNKLSSKKFLMFIFILSLVTASSCARIFHRDPEKKLFGKTHMNRKEAKVKEPRTVLRAKRKQEANDRKLQKQYDKSIVKSQKRTIDIQTPEVQARMKQNKKEITARDRKNKKKVRGGSKGAEKKYN
jgi:hypothetical protein